MFLQVLTVAFFIFFFNSCPLDNFGSFGRGAQCLTVFYPCVFL